MSREYGTSSNWSIQSIGNTIYFADESHFYKGVLRQAVENGLEVTIIDEGILEKYNDVINSSDVVSIYDPVHKSILWGTKILYKLRNNISFVYSLGRSGPKGKLGQQDVWAGWFEGDGYEPYTLSTVVQSDGSILPYRGDEDGYVYSDKTPLKATYKDELRVSGVTTDKDIVSEIITAPVMPGGMGAKKRARQYYPYLYQKYDASVRAQWIIDGRYLEPDINSDDRMFTLYNRVPFYRAATDTQQKQLWGNDVWNNEPVLPRPISVNEPFQYIQFVLRCDGSNNRDEMSYVGGELYYQMKRKSGRMVG